jgi:23S rRNA pseudouridine2605 synthase
MTEDDKPSHSGRKFRAKRLKTSLPRPQADQPAPPAKTVDRIAKVMARAGLTSRREAEAWIAAGRVSVNGETIRSPALNVGPKDRIAVDGKPLPQRERTRLFLFHKPRGLVTTAADTHGRPTIFGALPKDLPRLISIGRLDMNTEGLLLLTNDGGLARVLELPATGWLRRYRVRAYGSVTQDRLNELKNGITVDGVNYGSIEAALDRVQGSNVWITFAMREGKNREIRNVLRALGLQVNRLIRVSYGPFQLGELADGAVEEVKTRSLRDQIGPRLAALAGADFASEIVERETPKRETRKEAPRRDEPKAKPRERQPEEHRGDKKAPGLRRSGERRGEHKRTEQRGGQRSEHKRTEQRGGQRSEHKRTEQRTGQRSEHKRTEQRGEHKRGEHKRIEQRGEQKRTEQRRPGRGRPYRGKRDR